MKSLKGSRRKRLFNPIKDQSSAFTLVELLVVVAVLALLASMVFSNLTGAREGARISNILAFQSQVHNLMGSDLIGWWNFNEDCQGVSEGGLAPASIKNYAGGPVGSNNGAKCTSDSPVAGGSGIDVRGGSYHVSLGSYDFSPGVGATISIWYNSTFASGSQMVFGGQGALFCYSYISGQVRCDTNGSSSSANNFGGDTHDGNWHHLILSTDGTNAKAYLDGELGAQWSEAMGTGSKLYIIGNYNPGGSYTFDGKLDDVRIYSRALTAYEVQTLYAQTKGNYLVEDI